MSPRLTTQSLAALSALCAFSACKTPEPGPRSAATTSLVNAPAPWPVWLGDNSLSAAAPQLPALYEQPEVAWEARVGKQSQRTAPILGADMVILGSLGERVGAPDPGDGVYALENTTGARRWFTQTEHDALGVAWWRGLVIVNSGDGSTRALDARDGALVWSYEPESPSELVAFPLIMEQQQLVITADAAGRITALDARDGALRWMSEDSSREFSVPLASQGDKLFAASRHGTIHAMNSAGATLWTATIQDERIGGEHLEALARSPVSISRNLMIHRGALIVTYDRAETDREPAILGISMEDGTSVWDPIRTPGIARTLPPWQPLTFSPVTLGAQIFFGQPTTRAFVMATDRGRIERIVRIGPCMTAQPAHPVSVNGMIYIPRSDGALYALDEYGTGMWRIKLSGPGRLEPYTRAIETGLFPRESCHAPPPETLATTPAIDRDGSIFIADTTGRLYKLSASGQKETAEGDPSTVEELPVRARRQNH